MTLDQVSNLFQILCCQGDKKRSHSLTKLIDMGLFPGKEIRLLFKAPFGDPIAIDLQGYTLSLRREEAALISIE